jgi:hypothetical protein
LVAALAAEAERDLAEGTEVGLDALPADFAQGGVASEDISLGDVEHDLTMAVGDDRGGVAIAGRQAELQVQAFRLDRVAGLGVGRCG